MAKIKNIPPGGRSTRREGKFIVQPTRGGGLMIRSWPRKRGPTADPNQQYLQEQFALANKHSIRPIPWEHIEAENQSIGSMWNRRELLVKAAFGNFVEITLPDGQRFASFTVMAQEVQALLDTISDQVGVMLYRAADAWIALTPGADGDVLTARGVGSLPVWDSVPAPEAAAQWSVNGGTSNSTASNSSRGTAIFPAFDIEVTHALWMGNKQAGFTYKLTVCDMSSAWHITAIREQFDITALLPTGNSQAKIPLQATETVLANTRVAFIWSKIGGGGSASLDMWTGNNVFQGFPQIGGDLPVRAAIETPSVGDTFSQATPNNAFGLRWR